MSGAAGLHDGPEHRKSENRSFESDPVPRRSASDPHPADRTAGRRNDPAFHRSVALSGCQKPAGDGRRPADDPGCGTHLRLCRLAGPHPAPTATGTGTQGERTRSPAQRSGAGKRAVGAQTPGSQLLGEHPGSQHTHRHGAGTHRLLRRATTQTPGPATRT